jgi:hypothetical protein
VLRLFVIRVDAAPLRHMGEPPDKTLKTFDVHLPDVEKFLRDNNFGVPAVDDISCRLEGAELIENHPEVLGTILSTEEDAREAIQGEAAPAIGLSGKDLSAKQWFPDDTDHLEELITAIKIELLDDTRTSGDSLVIIQGAIRQIELKRGFEVQIK